MTVFSTPIDIANRALQLLGGSSITSFSDGSRNASVMGAAYGKLRHAELERNPWAFSIRRAWLYPVSVATMRMVPGVWNSATVYEDGAVVGYTDSYGDYNVWYSTADGNLGTAPGTPGGLWAPFFGPLLINQFIPQASSGTSNFAYAAGDVVYIPSGTGVNPVFLSLFDNNTEVPNDVDEWSEYQNPWVGGVIDPSQLSPTGQIIGQYNRGQIISYNGWNYLSLIDMNQNNEPDLSAPPFNLFTSYSEGDEVCGYDGMLYQSLVNSNVGNNPSTDSGVNWEPFFAAVPWTPTFTGTPSSLLWQPVSATLQAPNINYPLGAGPLEQTFNKNVFPLPANFLKRAPQDPRAGITSMLGAPSGLAPDDYTIENGFLCSRTPQPIPLRFLADVTDVTEMTAMFCEALSARLAAETCEIITQAGDKLQRIEQIYSVLVRDARLNNAIIIGPDTIAEDDFIVCRI